MRKWLITISLLSFPAMATDLVFQFKNPSFNGIGQSAHYLTIDEQERTRQKKHHACQVRPESRIENLLSAFQRFG